jgi:hypothetical protein
MYKVGDRVQCYIDSCADKGTVSATDYCNNEAHHYEAEITVTWDDLNSPLHGPTAKHWELRAMKNDTERMLDDRGECPCDGYDYIPGDCSIHDK